MRGEKKKKFSYRDIRNVYTIVLFEKSPKELYELDRNTVQYMIDEQQERLDAQKELLAAREELLATQEELLAVQEERINEQEEKIGRHEAELEKMLKGFVGILRGLKIPEPEIIIKICDQYQITEEDAKKYL